MTDDQRTDEELRDIVRHWWGALERGDMETVADCLTDDMTWEIMHVSDMMPCGGVFKGKEQIERELLPIVPTAFYIPGQTSFEITALHVARPVVVMEFTVNAVTAKGRTMTDARYISVITLENGTIKYSREYPDALKAKAAHLD
jgi:ketosteroid isomerase-like protein